MYVVGQLQPLKATDTYVRTSADILIFLVLPQWPQLYAIEYTHVCVSMTES